MHTTEERIHTTEERIKEGIETVQETMQGGREAAAGKMERAAESIRERAYGMTGDSRIKRAATRTADSMSNAAEYMRTHDAKDVWKDLTNFLKRHPTESIAVALLLGVLAGRSIKRS